MPGDWLADAFFIGAALKVPDLVSGVTVEQLVAALAGRDQQREYLVRHINAHHAADPKVIDYYLAALQKRDRWSIADLARLATDMNDPRFLTPAMEIVRDQVQAQLHYDAVRIAARHARYGPDASLIQRELSSHAMARCPLVTAGTVPKQERWRLQQEFEELGVTRDVSLVPKVRPYLERTDVVVDAKDIAAVNNGISLRVCDLAYNAILDLRDDQKTPRLSLWEPGWIEVAERSGIKRQRDALVAQMRRDVDAAR